MPLELFHIGEELLARMLACVNPAQVACKLTGRTLQEDVSEFQLSAPLSYHADEASLRIEVGSRVYDCDGEQTVDVLCVGEGRGPAIAIEAKLGKTLLIPVQFKRRFCVPCDISQHRDGRLRGSMIAVLDRSFPGAIPKSSRLICTIGDIEWTAIKPWWLFVRRTVVQRWIRDEQGPGLGELVRVADFDELVGLCGVSQFDSLVGEIVGSDFARRWGFPHK